jgi:hypothetical protein
MEELEILVSSLNKTVSRAVRNYETATLDQCQSLCFAAQVILLSEINKKLKELLKK